MISREEVNIWNSSEATSTMYRALQAALAEKAGDMYAISKQGENVNDVAISSIRIAGFMAGLEYILGMEWTEHVEFINEGESSPLKGDNIDDDSFK